MELSKILHNKIQKARGGRTDASLGNNIILTDHEACELWGYIETLQADIYNIKATLKKLCR